MEYIIGVDIGGTHGSSMGGRGFRLVARVGGNYRSESAGPRRSGSPRTASRHPATPAAGICFLWMVLLLVCSPVAAQQSAFDNYAHVQRNVFWPKLSACGGTTLYCGLPFAGREKSVDGRDLSIEHAYPADWIATHHGCENWKSCKVEAYGRAAADLHNLWPAIANINSSRQDQSLGEIPGEQQRRFQEYCPDYERTRGQEAIIEPRDAVKGDMAPSILYMLDSYGLPLPANLQRDMLLRWHQQDRREPALALRLPSPVPGTRDVGGESRKRPFR